MSIAIGSAERHLLQDSELRFLVRGVSWLAQTVNLSGDQVLGLLAERLSADQSLELVAFALTVDSTEQRRAEEAVVELLAVLPRVTRRQVTWRDEPGRHVDWARTALARATSERLDYANVTHAESLDLPAIGALKALALRWSSLLDQLAGREERVARSLRLANAAAIDVGHPALWGTAVAHRLRRRHAREVRAIERANELWNALRGEALGTELKRAFEELSSRGLTARNADVLLEWSVSLAVAGAAVANGWHARIEAGGARAERQRERLLLEREGLQAEVYKGYLHGADGQRVAFDDRLIALFKQAGLDGTGIQPDIVVTFSDGVGQLAHVIGDAKRSIHDDKSLYLRSAIRTMTEYLYAYGPVLPDEVACTIFALQGVASIAGNAPASAPDAPGWGTEVARILESTANLPAVLCLDLRHFGDEAVMAAWWRRVETICRARLTPPQTPPPTPSDQHPPSR